MHLKSILFPALAAVASAQSLTDVLSSNANLTLLVGGLLKQLPSLVSNLSAMGNITFFAPSNNAINLLVQNPAGFALANEPDIVAAFLEYHVLNGAYNSSTFPTMETFLPSLLTNTSYTSITSGQVVGVSKNGSTVDILSGLLQTSHVVIADLKFSGGYVHVIDTVLALPQAINTTAAALNLTSLVGALTMANLVNTVNSLPSCTVFAPSNAAFAAVASSAGNFTTAQLVDLLTYHVVNGTVAYSTLLKNETLTTVEGKQLTVTVANGKVMVNNATVTIPDVLVANGVVHVIDQVLMPSSAPSATSSGTATGGAGGAGTTATATKATSSGAVQATGAAPDMRTGAMGVGALFAGGAMLYNL